MGRARRRFRLGWALTGGIGAVVAGAMARADSGTSATVHASGGPLALSDTTRLVILLAGCAIAAGVGVYVALQATQIPASDRRWSALMWAAIGAAVAAANWQLADHNGPDWWYRSVSVSPGPGPLGMTTQTHFRNPWMVHLALTLPIAGGAGGLAQYLALTAAPGIRRIGQAVTWAVLWAAAFLVARYVGVIAVYLSTGAVADLFEVAGLGPASGTVLGCFIGGYLTGHLTGWLLSFSPGLAWHEPASPGT